MRLSVVSCFLAMVSFPAAAQVPLSLVEGAACAQLSQFIQDMGAYNTATYDEIGELQASQNNADRRQANVLLGHYERMVDYRRSLISDYELSCARGTMSYNNLRRVCSPQSSGKSFADTVFCEPLKGDE